jgi:aspartyl-tRNA(Asn)/glutamyl-tRNA(Gln) amidotransferase subunit A
MLTAALCAAAACGEPSNQSSPPAFDVLERTIPQLQAAMEAGRVTSRQIVAQHLARIEAYDRRGPALKALISINGGALDEAAALDRERVETGPRGPLHGVPVVVKDNYDVAGLPTTAGASALAEWYPPDDAFQVAKLKEAGAVLLGKLNLSEFALGESFHHPGGQPRNPWDLSRNPGISSSGSAAATAAFLCATSLAEDTGGSTRIPAAWSGLTGLRPTWGLVSRRGVAGVSWSMDTVGPISHSAEDCALTFQAIAGHDPHDQYSWSGPVPDYAHEIQHDIDGLRVGVLREKVAEGGLEPGVRQVIESAVAQLGELGATAQEVSIPIVENAGAISKCITDMDGAAVHYERLKTRISEYDHNTRVRLLTAILTPAQALYKAQKVRTLIRQSVLEALEEVDVIVLPTSPTGAPLLPTEAGIKSQDDASSRISGVRNFTGAFNVANLPALSIPCGFTEDNLPLSLQLVGKPMTDGLLMRVAHAYQQATDWHLRRPPLA